MGERKSLFGVLKSAFEAAISPPCQFCKSPCIEAFVMGDTHWFKKHTSSDSTPKFCSQRCVDSWVDQECARRGILHLTKCARCSQKASRRMADGHWFWKHITPDSAPRFCSDSCLDSWIDQECSKRGIVKPRSEDAGDDYDYIDESEFEVDDDGNDVSDHEGWCRKHQAYCWGDCKGLD